MVAAARTVHEGRPSRTDLPPRDGREPRRRDPAPLHVGSLALQVGRSFYPNLHHIPYGSVPNPASRSRPVRGTVTEEVVCGQWAGPHGWAREVWGRIQLAGRQLASAERVEVHRGDWRVLDFTVIV